MLTNTNTHIESSTISPVTKLNENIIEYEIKPAEKLSINFKELWQYRELFYYFSLRDIKVKYKQAYLGVAWVILQPLFMLTIMTFFFGRVLKVPSDGLPYAIFVYSGMIYWNIFSSGLSNSGDSMVSNSSVIKKIYFPRLIIPISSVLVTVFDFSITFILFIGLIIYHQVPINILLFILYSLSALLLTVITTLGLGIFLSALNVKYRDFKYIIPFLIQSTLFITPVIYPVSMLKFELAKYLLAINPLTGSILLSRAALSSAQVDWSIISISIASSLIIFSTGLVIFRKTESHFADLA